MKMNDVIRHNKKVGQHFFDKETMKYWGSRIETELFPNNTFVTSEDTYDRNGRLYTVRMYDPNTGRIKTLNSFQEFDNLRDAENFAKNYSSVKSSRKVQRRVMASTSVDDIISKLHEFNDGNEIIKVESFLTDLYDVLNEIRYLDDSVSKEEIVEELEALTELEWLVGDCDAVQHLYNILMDW